MKRRPICFLCVTVSLITSMTVSAAETDLTHERLTYQLCGDHIEITGCVGKVWDLIIPAKIEGLPVTTIQEGAFAGKTALYSLLIPESIIEIEAAAFAGCDGLDAIYYKGSPADWNAVMIGDGNQRLCFTDIYCDYNKQTVERENIFIPEKDNWCFANSSENFGDATYIMTEEHSDLAAERIKLNAGTVWAGSCYGMAVTTILACAGILDPAALQTGAASLYEIIAPPDVNVLSAINYYFNSQLAEPQRLDGAQYAESAAEKLQRLLGYLSDDSPVLLSVNGYFGENGYQNHAIVAYDVTYGSYEWDGVSYDGKILIYDNNYLDLPDHACLYFNSSDLTSYILPGCGIISGKQGGIMSVTEDLDILNYHGLFCGNLHEDSVSNHLVVSTDLTDMTFSLQPASYKKQSWESTGKLDTNPISYMDAEGILYLALDKETGYAVQTDTPTPLRLTVPYETFGLQLYADAASQAAFTPDGCIQLNGTDMNFSIVMTAETPLWEEIAVKGNDADTVFMELTENGCILKADQLRNTSVKVRSGEEILLGEFSVEYSEVLLTATEAGRIAVSADADGDGSYETDIPVVTEYTVGDVNFDGAVNAADAALILTAAAAAGTGHDSELRFLQEAAADVYVNGIINSKDAALVLKQAAASGVQSFDF